jgi:outer membrane protein assembly factor BamB
MTTHTRAIFFLTASLFVGAAQAQEPANTHEWSQYRGNPGCTGVSPDTSVKPPLKLVWSYRLDGDASSDAGAGVTVAAGNVFVNVANTKSILALNAHTGRFEWEYRDSYVGYRTVAAYSDGRLILWERQLKKRAVLALDASTGKKLWQQPLKADQGFVRRVGLPIAGGKILCSEGGDDPAVMALDEKTGKQLWRAALGKEDGTVVICPSFAGGRVFVSTIGSLAYRPAEGATIALDAASGKELWRRKNIFTNRSLVSDGKVVVCTMFAMDDTKSYLLDAKTGKSLWVGPAKFHYNSASLTDELVVIRPYGAECLGLDRDTGKERWKFQKPGVTSGCCSPAISGQYAYFGTGVVSPGDLESLASFQHVTPPRERGLSGTMHAIDLKTGKSVWQFGTANCICGDPALAYGKLYFTSRDGRVYCFAPAKAGEPTVPDAKDKTPPASALDIEALLAPKFTDRPQPGKDWPMQGGTPDRAGLAGASLKLPLEVAWKLDTGDRMVGAAAIRDGRAFVGSDSGKIIAADLKTGRKLWEFGTGAKVHCSPAVAGDLVYCGSDSGVFHALEADTGKQRWSFEAGGPVQASPAVVGGIVLFGANDHHVYALDRFTGNPLWSFKVNDYILQAPPVVHDDHVFVGQWTDWVWALDLKTGKMRWKTFIPVTIEALAYYRNKLYVRNPNWMVEVEPKTGQRLRIGMASWGWGGPAFVNNLMFQTGIQSQYGTSGATVTDLDEPGSAPNKKIPTLEEVRLLKRTLLKGAPGLGGMGTPLALGEALCFATASGKLVVTDLDGTQRWSFQLGGTCHASPVAADGIVLVGCDDGHLYAFRQKSTLP